jgi:YgiT-type zinc finger domain-containing protein
MQHIAYYTWVSGELITVPDFPAWVCDMCGAREYDQRAISWLNIILDPETGRKSQPQPPRPRPTGTGTAPLQQPDI